MVEILYVLGSGVHGTVYVGRIDDMKWAFKAVRHFVSILKPLSLFLLLVLLTN